MTQAPLQVLDNEVYDDMNLSDYLKKHRYLHGTKKSHSTSPVNTSLFVILRTHQIPANTGNMCVVRYSHGFTNNYLLPMCAAVWSVSNKQCLEFPIQVLACATCKREASFDVPECIRMHDSAFRGHTCLNDSIGRCYSSHTPCHSCGPASLVPNNLLILFFGSSCAFEQTITIKTNPQTPIPRFPTPKSLTLIPELGARALLGKSPPPRRPRTPQVARGQEPKPLIRPSRRLWPPGCSHRYCEPASRNISKRITLDACFDRGCRALAQAVSSVVRTATGAKVTSAGGTVEAFDVVVFATHSDVTLKILGNDATQAEREVLEGIPYAANDVYLHRDPALMPINKGTWASWNCLDRSADIPSETAVCVTYWVNSLQRLPEGTGDLFVTLNPQTPPAKDKTVRKLVLSHPVFSFKSREAQRRLPEIQGSKSTWFCGDISLLLFHSCRFPPFASSFRPRPHAYLWGVLLTGSLHGATSHPAEESPVPRPDRKQSLTLPPPCASVYRCLVWLRVSRGRHQSSRRRRRGDGLQNPLDTPTNFSKRVADAPSLHACCQYHGEQIGEKGVNATDPA